MFRLVNADGRTVSDKVTERGLIAYADICIRCDTESAFTQPITTVEQAIEYLEHEGKIKVQSI